MATATHEEIFDFRVSAYSLKPFEFVARSFREESVKNLKLTKCGAGEKMESKDDDFGGGNSIYGGIKK